MPEILKQYSLRDLNTFHLDVYADRFAECKTVRDVQSIIREPAFRKHRNLVIGEGSNILFVNDFKGFIIHPAIMGREIIQEDRETVLVQAGAGENWDDFVAWSTAWGFGGIENLSLIPGSVGSSPIQNIGAYGSEVSRTIEKVIATDILTGQKLIFENESCKFGYRDSIFKRGWKDKCIITSVVFRLSKQPKLNLSYQPVAEIMSKMKRQDVEVLRKIIIDIRRSRLPDPAELGNAGSFFKNPVISSEKLEELQSQYPVIPAYSSGPESIKIPAAWLIEECGWKGKKLGGAGTYDKQPLVLVNHGGANGKDILHLAENIARDVENRFGIKLEREVNVIL
jgi:UDP-N-acetylmuramate dehydrogenase